MTSTPKAEPRKPLPLPEIEAMSDPLTRAREAEAFLQYARHQASRSIQIRDAAIRAAKDAGSSQTAIHRETGINQHTVKAVLR